MSLDVAIKVDPGDSLAKIKSVEDGLKKTEDRGKAAGQSMLGLAGSFKSLAAAIEHERVALERAGAAHDRLTRQNQPLAQGFARLSEMMEREKRILAEIHGPAREYSSDLAALDQLLAKNVISTAQYAEQVTKLNQAFAKTPKPEAMDTSLAMNTIGFANTPQQGPTLAGGVRALASSPGLAAGGLVAGSLMGSAKVIEGMAHEYDELKDRYTELSNRALAFATDGRTVNSVIDQQRQLATDLRTTLTPTMELFNGVGDATRNLGMTTKEQIDLTRVLGMEMELSNKPVSEAAGLIQRLAVGFETGEGAGRQFKTIMAEYPRLADAAAEAFGTTAAGLEQMISDGKVKLPQLTQAWVTHSSAIVDQHKQRTATIEQLAAAEREEAEIAYNRGVPALMAYSKAGREWNEQMLRMRGEGGTAVADVLGQITQQAAEQAKKWKLVEEAAESAIGQKLITQLQAASSAASGLTGDIVGIAEALAEALASEGFYAIAKAMDPWFVAPETPKKIKKTKEELIDINAVVRDGAAAWDAMYKAQQRAAHEFDDPAGLKQQEDSEKKLLEQLKAREEAEKDYQKNLREFTQAGLDLQDELSKKAKEKADETKEAWATGLGSIAADFANMASSGEISLEKLGSSLAKLALQMAAMQIGGPWGAALGSFAGGLNLGGGANGFDHLVSSRPGLELPGFASGGSFTVGGSGGTDSKIAMFRVTPGESVHVRTPQQQQQAMAAAAPRAPTQVIIQMQNDRRDLIQGVDSRDGERVLANLDRRLGRGRRR